MNGVSPSSANPAGLIAARLRRGVVLSNGRVVGESDRSVHLFPLPSSGPRPAGLTALCGLVITPGTADLVHEVTGMPCEECFARAVNTARRVWTGPHSPRL